MIPRVRYPLVAGALVLAVQLLTLSLAHDPGSGPLELAAMDRVRSAVAPSPWPDDLVLVAIDAASIRENGRWPWGRDLQARLLDRIADLGAKTVVYDAFLSGKTDPAADQALAQAMARTPTVIMAQVVRDPEATHRDSAFLAQAGLPGPASPEIPPARLLPPDPMFAQAARAVGHAYAFPGSDERIRSYTPLLGTGDRALPSIALLGVLLQRGQDPQELRFSADSLRFPDGRTLRLSGGQRVLDPIRSGDLPPVIPAGGLLGSKAEAFRERIQGKLALVYLDLLGTDRVATPADLQFPGGLVNAHAIRGLTTGREWRVVGLGWIQLGLLVFALAAVYPARRLGPPPILAATVGLGFAYLLTAVVLAREAFWILPVLPPLATIVLTGAAFAGLAHRWTLRRAEKAEARADADKAPKGWIALVFSDVEGSTLLWEKHPRDMGRALELHNTILRRELLRHQGYEVKTEGDSFMVAFSEVRRAVAFCRGVQAAMAGAQWPPSVPPLKVRMGIHCGTPEPKVDPLTGRMDYFGPAVNRAARVAAAAQGGQVLLSAAAWKEMQRFGPASTGRELGTISLKGLSEPERVIELMPG